jgi:hypothetical protein
MADIIDQETYREIMQDALWKLRESSAWQRQLALTYFTTYQSLVDAGFSAMQAFELVRTRGWNLMGSGYDV